MSQSLIILSLASIVSACSDGCGNDVAVSSDAPDGRHRAVLFKRGCGATTGFSTQVAILDPNEKLIGIGNAFRADDDHGAAPVGTWGGPRAEIKWLAADHLLIRYAAKSRIFAKASSVSDVQITYEVLGR